MQNQKSKNPRDGIQVWVTPSPGDLVFFDPSKSVTGPGHPGSLTAVKYYERIRKQVSDQPGIVMTVSGKNCSVMFGTVLFVIHKDFLSVA